MKPICLDMDFLFILIQALIVKVWREYLNACVWCFSYIYNTL